jgi:hypothetical protein
MRPRHLQPMKVTNSRTHTCSLTLLSVALLALPLGTSGQTATTKPAAYECSGLEGAALTSCRDLNAAAANSAAITTNQRTSHDCSGMTGGSLTTCMDLNGQLTPALPNGSGVGPSLPVPSGSTTGQSQTLPSGAMAGQVPMIPSGTMAGQAQPLAGTGQVVTPLSSGANPVDRSTGSAAVPDLRAPDGGNVPPPSDRIVPLTEGSKTTSAAPAAAMPARAGGTSRSPPASAK